MTVAGQTGASDIAAGRDHTCVLRSGSVYCWGSNQYRQLGATGFRRSLRPRRVAGLDKVVGIDAGAYHTCARRSDKTVWCWGMADSGQIGDGRTNLRAVAKPSKVYNLYNVQHISVGGYHACARRFDHALFCWGSNGFGEIGDGTFTNRFKPRRVPGY
jgi:alpha-tubulin suppressor-like RCC1 family protein